MQKTVSLRSAPLGVYLFAALLALLVFPCSAFAEDAKISIIGAEVEIENTSYVYSGSEMRPAVKKVTLNGTVLRERTDYMVSYVNNTNAGTGVVVISGINSYTNQALKEFTIAKRPVTVTARSASKPYDGSALFASESGYDVSGLVNASDITHVALTGSQAVVGSSEAVVGACSFASGKKQNYELTKKNGTLTITAAPITSVELSQNSFVYNGTQQRPEVTVKWAKGTVQRVYYNIAWSEDTTNPGTKTITVNAGGNFTGMLRTTYTIVGENGGIDMYRLYNPNSGEHFYTADASERDYLSSLGWNYEGVGWVAPVESDTPVYRLYNPNAGDHHYTTSAQERDELVALGWNNEDVGWYSSDESGAPLYRQYNPNQFACNHNYTTSLEENDQLVSLGWNAEGIGWYGLK